MGTDTLVFMGYNDTIEELEKYVNDSTEFEKAFYIVKRFVTPKGYTLKETFERVLRGMETGPGFGIRIAFCTPDLKQSRVGFTLRMAPKILTLYTGIRAFSFEKDEKTDLHIGFRDEVNRFPMRVVGYQFLIRNVALSAAQLLDQDTVIYATDQGELAEDIGHRRLDGITMIDLIKYLKEKEAFAPLSEMLGFGGVQKVFYETVNPRWKTSL